MALPIYVYVGVFVFVCVCVYVAVGEATEATLWNRARQEKALMPKADASTVIE
jgi:hypothetical protein